MQFFVTERIGEKRSRTPEGFLVCHDVPLARIGEQLYRPSELLKEDGEPVVRPRPGTDHIRVMRDADQVFHPDTIRSAEGKPFVVTHPDGMVVTPKNFRELAAGHIQNVRRGEGSLADLMLGDIVVNDEEAIDLIENKDVREISLGYDCEYDELGFPHELPSGVARQRGIIINHAALVEAGRCGPRCAIGDRRNINDCNGTETPMANGKPSIGDRIRAALKINDTAAVDAALSDLGAETAGADIVIHNHLAAAPAGDRVAVGDGLTVDSDAPAWFAGFVAVLDKRLKAIDKRIADADKEDEEDEERKKKKAADAKAKDAEEEEERKKKDKDKEKETNDESILAELDLELPEGLTVAKVGTGDSVAFDASFQNIVAGAEILAPGIRVPTFDAKLPAAKTFDAMCGLRRKALGFALEQPETAGMIEQVTNGRMIAVDKAPCGYVRTVFDAVVALRKAANNGAAGGGVITADRGGVKTASSIRSIADLNAHNAARFKGGGERAA